MRQSCLWAVVLALLVVLSPAAQAAKVLFVTTGTPRDSVKLSNILDAQGHDLTIHDTAVSGNALTAAEYAAQGFELLIVDEVIGSGNVGDRFRNSSVPVINLEGFLYSGTRSAFNTDDPAPVGGTFSNATYAAQQDAASAADFGQVQSTTAIDIIDPNHPLAAGLPAGQVDVFDPNTPPPTGSPADGSGVITFAGGRTFIPDVQVVATIPDFANGYCVFGVDAGVMNADGTTNLARWVHLPWNDSDPARIMIEPSFFLFEAAVAWTLELPEPTKIRDFSGGHTDGTNAVMFSVDKVSNSGSAVSESGIGLTVGSQDVSGDLMIVDNGTHWGVTYTGLDENLDYTAVASATAADGGFSARKLSFNTFIPVMFDPSYYTFEAEDFNFGGGQFFDNVVLCNGPLEGGVEGCYFARVGFTNIDKLEIDFMPDVVIPTTATEVYRFGGTVGDPTRYEWVDTYLTSDPLVRPQYTTAGISEYEVRNITTGEWLNYTRTVPATNYNIYARVAGSDPIRVQMDFVTAGATTTNQTLQPVGEFIRNNGTSGGEYELVPLTDDSGTNLLVVPFDGSTRTMRLTAMTDGYSMNFLMFVPSGEQISPIVTITDPADASIVDEGVEITILADANDADGTVSQVEFFAGTAEPLASVGVDTEAPYSASFTPPALGVFATYTIRAVATDNNSNTSQDEIVVTAQPPSTLPPAGKLADIIWVSFHTNGPSTAAAGAGFTNAPDKGYTDLLTASGYNVTRYLTTGAPDPAVLAAADLVIIGRSVNSGNYQNASASAWNNIATPIINMAGYTLRNSRLGFVTASTTPADITNDVTLAISNPAHPIFAGISLTGGTMDNPFAGMVSYPAGVAGNAPRGISISPDPADADGTVLATVSSAGNVPIGAMVIAEWQAGTQLTHAGGDGTDTLAGRRLVFLSGSREGDGVSSETAGLFDLTADGTQMFLNAVEYMLHPEPYKVTWVTFHSADDVPSTAAAGANRGFTNAAPDKGYTDLLTANGYEVTRYVTTGTPDPVVLNAADVVIIGRSVNSGNYQNASASAWNNITTPIVNMAGYTLRNSRLGFVTASTTPVDTTAEITLTVSDPMHYIFNGIPLTGGTMDNPFAGLAMYPDGGLPAPRGISISTDPANAGGTVLATVSAAGGGPANAMVIGEWQAGTVLSHAGGDGNDSLGGARLIFLSGSREGDGVNSETAGIFDLAPDGAQMFLNTVRYAASRKGAAAPAELLIESATVVGGNQLQLTVSGGTGSFILQTKSLLSDPTWVNVSTNSGSSVMIPIGTGDAYFRLQAQ